MSSGQLCTVEFSEILGWLVSLHMGSDALPKLWKRLSDAQVEHRSVGRLLLNSSIYVFTPVTCTVTSKLNVCMYTCQES